MRGNFRWWLLVFSLSVRLVAAERSGVRVLYTANRQGEIEPCGCQIGQIGGINQMANFVSAQRASGPVLFVDSGDTFFSHPEIPEIRKVPEILRAELIADAYRLMEVDALVPGERDLALGLPVYLALTKKTGARVLASNLSGERPRGIDRELILERGRVNYGLIGLVNSETKIPGTQVTDPAKAVREALTRFKAAKVERVIVLSHLGLSADRKLGQSFSDLWILGSHSLDLLSEPERHGTSLIFQPQNEGQQIGYLDDKGSGGQPNHGLIDLKPEWDKDGPVKLLLSGYREKMRQREIAAKAVSTTPQAGSFVGHPVACRTCHAKQYDFWATTKHASAYLVLYAKNQHFDADCIGCHTLGFQTPGAFEKITEPIRLSPPRKQTPPFIEILMADVFTGDEQTPLDSRKEKDRYQKLHDRYLKLVHDLEAKEKFKNVYLGVQCEHCHGSRVGHPSPNVVTQKKVKLESCQSCHRPPNAPVFDPKTIEKVACPLMARNR